MTEITLGDSPNGEDASNLVGTVVFNAGASPYRFTITPVYDTEFPSLLVVYQSITNNSGVVQNFVTANSGTAKASGRLYFDAGHSLSVGNNNLSTSFSGVIQESGGGEYLHRHNNGGGGNATG
jgi:hypothetical protein